MKLVIDLQGWQTESRRRGVGRYTLGLTKAMLRGAGRHEIVLALNGRDPDDVRAARQEFSDLLPLDHIRAWQAPHHGAWAQLPDRWRIRAAELLRENFLAGLGGDAVHVSALQEGFYGGAATSIGLLGARPPTGAMVYDLTPARLTDLYVPGGPIRDWYQDKLRSLRRAQRWLAISAATRADAIAFLGLNPAHVVNISAGVDAQFLAARASDERLHSFAATHGLADGFILYYGGFDPHKNVARLIEAYGLLPPATRRGRPLAIVGAVPAAELLAPLEQAIARSGLAENDVRFLGRVEDAELILLLQACTLFVYPSLLEGFGLPVLEAMAAGAATLCGDASCLPEVIGRADATFDAKSAASIAERMRQGLEDDAFRGALQAHGRRRAKLFSWENSARKAFETYESLDEEERAAKRATRAAPGWAPARRRLAWLSDWPMTRLQLASVARLGERYDIDLFVEPDAAAAEVVVAGAPTLSINAFDALASGYERVVIDRVDARAWLKRCPAVIVSRADGARVSALETQPDELGLITEPAAASGDDAADALARWADEAVDTIEEAYVAAASPVALTRALADCTPESAGEAYERALAAAIVANHPASGPPRLLVDVSWESPLAVRGGIARVVSEITRALLACPPPGLEVTPVRVLPDQGRILRARNFSRLLADASEAPDLDEDDIEMRVGDRLLVLALNHALSPETPLLRRLRELGGQAHAVVYDLLPLQRPEWFEPWVRQAHRRWFDAVGAADGLACISQAVAEDVRCELRKRGREPSSPKVAWFHLGSHFANGPTASPSPILAGRRNILHVSQLWARKGHEQTLNAFEILWAAGGDVSYVIAGRPGYGVDDVIERLRAHPERGRRLHWFEDCDDAALAGLYANADGVLVPSGSEGFGLPLVEAIGYRRPVLCRDLPVFRELVGDAVRYFEGLDAASLAVTLRSWLGDLASGAATPATGVRLLSWREAAAQLLAAIGLAGGEPSSLAPQL